MTGETYFHKERGTVVLITMQFFDTVGGRRFRKLHYKIVHTTANSSWNEVAGQLVTDVYSTDFHREFKRTEGFVSEREAGRREVTR